MSGVASGSKNLTVWLSSTHHLGPHLPTGSIKMARKIYSRKHGPPSRLLAIQSVDGAAPGWWNVRRLWGPVSQHLKSGKMLPNKPRLPCHLYFLSPSIPCNIIQSSTGKPLRQKHSGGKNTFSNMINSITQPHESCVGAGLAEVLRWPT